MRDISRSHRKPFEILVFLVFFAAAAFLYFSNLHGTLQTNGDENRVYRWNPFAPILYLISSPFTHLFHDQSAPYYVMAVLGTSCLALTYMVTRCLLGPKAAFWAALFYLTNELALAHARLLYYSTLVNFLVLLCMAAYMGYRRTGRYILLAATGGLLGLMFYAHPSTYALIAGFLIWVIWIDLNRVLGVPRNTLWTQLFWMAAGATVAYVGIEVYSFFRVHQRPDIDYIPQWKFLNAYREGSAGYGSGLDFLAAFLKQALWDPLTSSVPQFFKMTLTVITAVGAMFAAWKKRDRALGSFAVLGLSAAGIICLSVVGEVQGVYLRQMVWIVPLLAAAFGYASASAMNLSSRPVRFVCAALLAVYFVFAFAGAKSVTESFVSSDPINEFLEDQGIQKNKILTAMEINTYEDYRLRRPTLPVPFVHAQKPEDIAKEIHYHINWPAVYLLYLSGKADYYLTSAIGHVVNVDLAEPLLDRVRPIRVWNEHPYNNPYAFSYDGPPGRFKIRLFALEDIFRALGRPLRKPSAG